MSILRVTIYFFILFIFLFFFNFLFLPFPLFFFSLPLSFDTEVTEIFSHYSLPLHTVVIRLLLRIIRFTVRSRLDFNVEKEKRMSHGHSSSFFFLSNGS